MFFSCPHCRELVATDRDTRLPPPMCPRCGGTLREPDIGAVVPATKIDSGLSFASFLRGDDPPDAGSPIAEIAAPAEFVNEFHHEQLAAEAAIPVPEAEAGADAAFAESTAIELPAAGPDSPIATQAIPQPAFPSHGHIPSFMRRPVSQAASPRAAPWQWAAVLVLASLLVVQVLVADRARLALDAGWRPMITALCGLLGCSVPAWHQPGAIAMLSRDVSPIAGSSDGLDVRATFRNDARWSQHWPVLLLSLSDADGRVLGSRAFLPHEYLGAEATQSELAPGQSARIELKLREPNPDVVAFSFDFR